MQAVILAAGEGVRLRPLTLDRPKPLLEVCGQSILEHIVCALPDAIEELIIVIRYKGEQIQALCGHEFHGRAVRYVVQGDRRGTAAALLDARPLLRGRFFLASGDDLLARADLATLVRHECAILACPHQTPERFGVISVDKDGTVNCIEEKPLHPRSNLVNAGATVLTQEIFDQEPFERAGELVLAPMVGALAAVRPVVVVRASFWYPIGTPADLAAAETVLRSHAPVLGIKLKEQNFGSRP